jgi:nicotinate dehydrogenase subunit A
VSGAVELMVNGFRTSLAGDADRPLLDALRHDLGLTASRFGCGEGLCGACHVIVDGRVVTACDTPLSSLAGRSVITLEGLGSAEAPHPLQEAFIAEQAMQCGYCISGVIISAAALLAANSDPSDLEIRQALQRNLCRCGSHNRMLRAIRRAAAMLRQTAARA